MKQSDSDSEKLHRLVESVADAYFECGEALADEQYSGLLRAARKAKDDLIQWVTDKLTKKSAVDNQEG